MTSRTFASSSDFAHVGTMTSGNASNAPGSTDLLRLSMAVATEPADALLCTLPRTDDVYRNRVVVALPGATSFTYDRIGRTAKQIGQQVDDFRHSLFFIGRLHYLTKIWYLNGLSSWVFVSGYPAL